MKNTFLILTMVLVSGFGVFGQGKTVSAIEIVNQINASKAVSIENATVVGDLDLTNLSNQTNDSIYPENGRTAKVFSNKISQPISFKNVKFSGNLSFFRKDSEDKEICEYRVVFEKSTNFENCVFEKQTNFELTNFAGEASFANSIFKQKPLLIRVGVEKSINLEGTIFEQGSVFQFTQNDIQINRSVAELQTILKRLADR
jgi:Pentapeptide repeats (9 copies)